MEMGACLPNYMGHGIKLDDCSCQPIPAGPLHSPEIDYGDSLDLNGETHQRLTAIDREEWNRYTLLDLAAGIGARNFPVA